MSAAVFREETYLEDEQATLAYGAALCERLEAADVVFLHGDLGAGKTTLVKGILRGLGHTGSVKSPTYTLLEPYELPTITVYHFDFYRIADSRELEFVGIDELMDSVALKLVEWPENAIDRLPRADVEVWLQFDDRGRRVEVAFSR